MDNRKKGSRTFPLKINRDLDNEGFLGYALKCSLVSAENLSLSRMGQAANLRKQMRELVNEWVQVEAEALFAKWVTESQRLLAEEENKCRLRMAKYKA